MNRHRRRAAGKQGQPPQGQPPRIPAAAPPPQSVPPGIAELLAQGIAHHQAGRLPQAETCYRQVLAGHPSADAAHLLGVIAYQVGRHDIAVDLIRQAIARDPGNPAFFTNLGNTLRDQGKLDEAVAAFRDAIRVDPSFAAAYCNLGTAFSAQGKLEEADAVHRQAIRIHPNFVEAHFNLGNALRGQGKLEEAVAACREAIRIRPDAAMAHCNLGAALCDQGKFDEAVAACREAIRIAPDLADAHAILGACLTGAGKLDDAVAACREAIRIKPSEAGAFCNLGNALRDQNKLDEAVAAFRDAVRINPNFAMAHGNLANALAEQGRFAEAIPTFQHAIVIDPRFAEARFNLGNALRNQNRFEEAVGAFRDAIRIKPNLAMAYGGLASALYGQGKFDEAAAVYREADALKLDFDAAGGSTLLFGMNYGEHSPAALLAAHRAWEERHGRPRPTAHVNDRSVARRLKVGYVSPDFRQHSVAYFLEPLLRNHDRTAVELFCYAEVNRPDAVTGRFRQLADCWVTTVGMPDEAMAERIRRDGIDVLVDLAGHSSKNRLPVFARKPAPIQVTWLGYPNTTGLEAIDYRLVDAVTDPEGEADAFASETLVRLPGGFLCYGGSFDAPVPGAAPCLAAGTITFGSFNSPAKLSGATLDAWAALLTRLPGAHLLLKGNAFADEATRAACFDGLRKRGVAAERVEILAWLPDETHLALYDRVDVALDPFPYNGTTTTCEALWMGVPVVTLCGDRHAGRVGASLLTQLGLSDLIAGSVEEYLEIAVALAGDPARIASLRGSLRPRVAASQLCDARGFARKIEAAYRSMWQRWCATNPPRS